MDTDLMGGQITMAFDATPTALPLAKSGKLRALGAGMAKRSAAMPDLPTFQEQGLKGYECYTWNALLAPARTPKPIVDKLNEPSTRRSPIPRFLPRWKRRASIRRRAARPRLRPHSSRRSSRNGRRSSKRPAHRSIECRGIAYTGGRSAADIPATQITAVNSSRLKQLTAYPAALPAPIPCRFQE